MDNRLFPLVQYFGLLSPTDKLEWPSGLPITTIQEFLVEQILDSEHFNAFPPSPTFQRRFWKWIVEEIEGHGEEVDERIYTRCLNLLSGSSVPDSRPPPPTYVTYICHREADKSSVLVHEYCSYTLYESRTLIESGTTGLTTWKASFALADYLSERPELICDQRVLELGSGAGFLGTVIGDIQMSAGNLQGQGQQSLCLSDVDEQVLVRCRSNALLLCNRTNSHPSLHFKLLNWTDALDERRRHRMQATIMEINPNLVLGADLVYDPSIIPALVATIKSILNLPLNNNEGSRRAIIAVTVRNENTVGEFIRQCRAVMRLEEHMARLDGPFGHLAKKQIGVRQQDEEVVKILILT